MSDCINRIYTASTFANCTASARHRMARRPGQPMTVLLDQALVEFVERYQTACEEAVGPESQVPLSGGMAGGGIAPTS